MVLLRGKDSLVLTVLMVATVLALPPGLCHETAIFTSLFIMGMIFMDNLISIIFRGLLTNHVDTQDHIMIYNFTKMLCLKYKIPFLFEEIAPKGESIIKVIYNGTQDYKKINSLTRELKLTNPFIHVNDDNIIMIYSPE